MVAGNGDTGISVAAGADANVIRGNYVGLDAAGTGALANDSRGIAIASANNTIGGTAAADRNVISGNTGNGIDFRGATATGNLLQGNYIGTDVTGTVDLGNTGDGVELSLAATNNTVGGAAAGAGNLISGNTNAGVLITTAGSNGNVVQGNRIGTDVTGTVGIANNRGVNIQNITGATIGGTLAGEGNLIAFNLLDGVHIQSTASGVRVLGNAIHSNTTLGIDLVGGTEDGFGTTANDALDADTGANRLQNYPLLYGAAVNGANLTVYGEINAAASRLYRIEFFASPAADPSGHGEGARYLGFLNVTTDAAGYFQYSTTLVGAAVAAGEVVTATATDLAANETSEFSTAVVAQNRTISGTIYNDVNGNANVADDGGRGVRERRGQPLPRRRRRRRWTRATCSSPRRPPTRAASTASRTSATPPTG